MCSSRTAPSFFTYRTRNVFNTATMVCDEPMSSVGPDGMDFMPGVVSYIMSHAAGGVKPWNKKMLWSALQGISAPRGQGVLEECERLSGSTRRWRVDRSWIFWPLRRSAVTSICKRALPAAYISLRFSSDFDIVTSSAYSRSLPTGMPMAMRVARTPSGLSRRARYTAVASPSTVGLVARMISDRAVLQPRQQLLDVLIAPAHAPQRADRAVQHVVHAVKRARRLNRQNVGRLFDYADLGPVAVRIGAVGAQLGFADVAADRAQPQLLFHVHQRGHQTIDVLARRAQQVERNALRGFLPDAGQSFYRQSGVRAVRQVGSASRRGEARRRPRPAAGEFRSDRLQAPPARHAGSLLLGFFVDLARGFAEGRLNHVLQHLRVARRFRVDLHAQARSCGRRVQRSPCRRPLRPPREWRQSPPAGAACICWARSTTPWMFMPPGNFMSVYFFHRSRTPRTLLSGNNS